MENIDYNVRTKLCQIKFRFFQQQRKIERKKIEEINIKANTSYAIVICFSRTQRRRKKNNEKKRKINKISDRPCHLQYDVSWFSLAYLHDGFFLLFSFGEKRNTKTINIENR